jgi:hypothetical protein
MAEGIGNIDVEYNEQVGTARRVRIHFGSDCRLELSATGKRCVLTLAAGPVRAVLPVGGPRDLFARGVNLLRLYLPDAAGAQTDTT